MKFGTAYITVGDKTLAIHLEPLECARIACQARGYDVDAEPTGKGHQWKVTATSFNGKVSLSRTGPLTEACERLIESIQ